MFRCARAYVCTTQNTNLAGAQTWASDRGKAGEGDAKGRGERAEDGRAPQEDSQGGRGVSVFGFVYVRRVGAVQIGPCYLIYDRRRSSVLHTAWSKERLGARFSLIE